MWRGTSNEQSILTSAFHPKQTFKSRWSELAFGPLVVGIMRTPLACLWPLALLACEQPAPVENRSSSGQLSRTDDSHVTDRDRLPHPPAPPPPAQTMPGLAGLTEASIRSELGSGAHCALVADNAHLLVATLGDALVNDGGRLVHLKPQAQNWQSLVRGGRFVAPSLVIEVTAREVRTPRGELAERDTDLRLSRGIRGFVVFHGPPWICGS